MPPESCKPGCRNCAAIDADNRRIRAELRDRLDRLDDVAFDRALRWIAEEQPDVVNEALLETEAPA